MKIEVKFSYTKTGPKAFIRPYTDEWEPTTTALRAYRKDMRNIKEATQFPEGEGYYAVMNPWLLESVLKANDIDAMQLVKAAQMENPPLENVRSYLVRGLLFESGLIMKSTMTERQRNCVMK